MTGSDEVVFSARPIPLASRSGISPADGRRGVSPGRTAGRGGGAMIGQEVLAPATETESLRQQLLQAQRLSSVGELASSIAHEFNNILTTIINSAKLGMRNPDTGEKQQAFERIAKAGLRASAIASGM